MKIFSDLKIGDRFRAKNNDFRKITDTTAKLEGAASNPWTFSPLEIVTEPAYPEPGSKEDNTPCHYCGCPSTGFNFFDEPVCRDCK